VRRCTHILLLFLFFFVGIFHFPHIHAQVTDSLESNPPALHSPHRATVSSLVLPGAGQVYNKKVWKVPIIYGALGASAYFFNDFNKKVKSQNAYFTELYSQNKQPTIFEIEKRDNDRVSRDVAGIAFVVIYVLQVVDATVDAHFFEFNIDQKLGVSLLKSPQNALSFTYRFP